MAPPALVDSAGGGDGGGLLGSGIGALELERAKLQVQSFPPGRAHARASYPHCCLFLPGRRLRLEARRRMLVAQLGALTGARDRATEATHACWRGMMLWLWLMLLVQVVGFL